SEAHHPTSGSAGLNLFATRTSTSTLAPPARHWSNRSCSSWKGSKHGCYAVRLAAIGPCLARALCRAAVKGRQALSRAEGSGFLRQRDDGFRFALAPHPARNGAIGYRLLSAATPRGQVGPVPTNQHFNSLNRFLLSLSSAWAFETSSSSSFFILAFSTGIRLSSLAHSSRSVANMRSRRRRVLKSSALSPGLGRMARAMARFSSSRRTSTSFGFGLAGTGASSVLTIRLEHGFSE